MKSSVPKSRFKPGDVINLDNLPPGTVVVDTNYVFFLVGIIVNFRNEIDDDEVFRRRLKLSGFSQNESNETIKFLDLINANATELEVVAGYLFALLTVHQLEDLINIMLTEKGYTHNTPQTRGLLGRKLLELSSRSNVGGADKIRYIEILGTNCMCRMLETAI